MVNTLLLFCSFLLSDHPSNICGEINKITLCYNDPKLEREYINRRDSSFKCYVTWAFVIFAFMMAIQFIILDR